MSGVLLLFATLFATLTHAAWQQYAYLAMHGETPRYLGVGAMPYANAHAPKGGILIRSAPGTFDNLNSMNGAGSYTEGVNFLFDSLMARSLDEAGVMYPLLAEKVSYDADNLQEIIFHLNPQASFSDGSPVTAEDVQFTFEIYQSKANLGLQMYISDLAKTEVLSKYQVKMIFKSKHNTELPSILAELPIYSKADWQNKDFSRISLSPILGSGPYVIARIDPGRSITYKRNPQYWARDLAVNRGRYNFDYLKYIYYRSTEMSYEGFKAGQFSLREENSAKRWMTGYQFPAAQQGLIEKYQHRSRNPVTTQSYVFNMRRAPFDNILLRQAISYAYDFEWMNKSMFYGQYQRLNSFFQNSELAATGPASAAEREILTPYLRQLNPVQRAGVLIDWQAPVSDGSGYNRAALLQARQLLQQAGYQVKQGRLVDGKGQALQFEILVHQQNLIRTMMPFVRNLKKLGINATVRQVDVPQYLERIRRYDFDMTSLAMPQSLSPGNEQAQMWGSQAADEIGNYNLSGIKNPVIDQVIAKIIQAPNREQQVLYTKVLDRLLRAGYYQILGYSKADSWFVSWKMYQRPQRAPQLSSGIEYWWSDPQQAARVVGYLGKNAMQP
ncbi:extracellular solute-binding protein [Acinetobacter larvae]|uniref:ABC transporter substrate-binding protein n=1 Tax=Acinetobacter larvae TaxID=1789224 RepID=A0A1B2M108_9GAMM|nr:ABC transporter substrate-binding protein [Acinetobacter larvae]